MINILSNLFFPLYIFLSWFLAGLGPTIILLPKNYRRYSFLISPLVGLCLLTLIGLFQITVVLMPLTPRMNVASLIIFSLLICFWTRREYFKLALKSFRRAHLTKFLLLPFFLMIVYAWLFHHNGYHLLVGSSDPLQYCENARHIREVIHTGSSLDAPIARQDHFIYDMTTSTQPYLKTQRRGAETMLATNTSLTSLSYQEMFPITMLCAFLTLALAVGFLGRAFLRLSKTACVILQLTFLGSFFLLLLHIQGSLAMSIGMAPGLITLAFLTKLIQRPSWRWLALTTLIMGGYFSIYSEPALFNILIPTVMLIFLSIFRGKRKFFMAISSVVFVYLLVALIAPFAIWSVLSTAYGNAFLVATSLFHPATHATPQFAIKDLLSVFTLPIWNLTGVVIGITSYYDSSYFNASISTSISNNLWTVISGFFLLGLFGLIGLFKNKNLLLYLYAIPLLLWMCSSLIMAQEQDYLRFARSLHYSMPFIIIGLVVLTSRRQSVNQPRWKNFWKIIAWISPVLLLTFISFNFYTCQRTINFVSSHNFRNDPTILRFDDHASFWLQFKNELNPSIASKTPILISGFNETIRPLAISIMLRDSPHVLGLSILNFWKIYDISIPPLIDSVTLNSLYNVRNNEIIIAFKERGVLTTDINRVLNVRNKNIIDVSSPLFSQSFNSIELSVNPSARYVSSESSFWRYYSKKWAPLTFSGEFTKAHAWWLRCNTRLTEDELYLIFLREGKPWYDVESELIDKSKQAIVATNNGYPIEWQDSKDVFPPKIIHFSNIGDVIYRNEYTVTLDNHMISPLKHDKKGPFRLLLLSGTVTIHDKENSNQQLMITYEGKIKDVALEDKNKITQGKISDDKKLVKITLNIQPNETTCLKLLVTHPVILRSISWAS